MEDQLTTRQVAEALQVSESSVKRWCDRGVLPTIRTAGGHRRIPLDGFMKYLEESNQQVVAPVFPATRVKESETAGKSDAELEREFCDAVGAGNEEKCRQILTRFLAQQRSLTVLADDFIAKTFHELGEQWSSGDLEVYQERRGGEICSRLIHEMRRLLPTPPENAPLAIGGSPEGDHYTTSTRLIELVLREAGWQTMNLGSNLPLDTIASAVSDHRPKMLWLSISHIEDEAAFMENYSKFYEALPKSLAVVVGGRALTDRLRPQLDYTAFCDNMRQLKSFATALMSRRHSIDTSNN